jgi:hypothetical protein
MQWDALPRNHFYSPYFADGTQTKFYSNTFYGLRNNFCRNPSAVEKKSGDTPHGASRPWCFSMENVQEEVNAGGSAGINDILERWENPKKPQKYVDSPPWGYCDIDLCPPAPTPDPNVPTPAPGKHPASTMCKPGQFERIKAKSSECKNCPIGSYAPHALAVPDIATGRTGPNFKEGCTACPGGYFSSPSKDSCTKECRDATRLEMNEVFNSDTFMEILKKAYSFIYGGTDLDSCEQVATKVEDPHYRRYSMCEATGGFADFAHRLCPVSCGVCPCSAEFPKNCPGCGTGRYQSTLTFENKSASCKHCAQVRCRTDHICTPAYHTLV